MPLGRKLEEAAASQQRRRKRGGGSSREWLHLVDVDDFLETMEVGRVMRSSGDERNFSCPFPGHTHGDTRASAYMNDGTKDESKATMWKCHGCGRSGNAITFYAEIENVSRQEAAAHLREQYAPNFRPPKGGAISIEFEDRLRRFRTREEPYETPQIDEDVYDERFGVDWRDAWRTYNNSDDCPPEVAYMFDRGFEPETLTAWGIGYDDDRQRITIPVRTDDGALIGVKGRSWKSKAREKIKYLIYGDKEGERAKYGWAHYEKSRVVFGLEMLAGPVKALVLVEGELDVIALWQVGIPAACTGSAHLSDEQALLVRQYCDEVIIFYDTNTAGEQATWGWSDKHDDFHPGAVQKLEPFIRVRVVADHEGDASELVQHGRVNTLRGLILDAPTSLSSTLLD